MGWVLIGIWSLGTKKNARASQEAGGSRLVDRINNVTYSNVFLPSARLDMYISLYITQIENPRLLVVRARTCYTMSH
jgi:hypothetical protein